MTPKLNIIQAMDHPRIFGGLPAFQNPDSWKAWRVSLKAAYGLPLTDEELPIFLTHTGRTVYAPPAGGFKTVVYIVGRQSGKTRIAALIADYEAISAPSEADETYAVMIAQDHRAAMRALFGYAKSPFEHVPALKNEVFSVTADTVKLANRVTLAAYPCRPAAIRGLRARVVVIDELAFLRSTDNLPMDVEMLRAVRPCLATTGGKLIILSSPYGQSGALWDLYREHYGNDDSSVLVWKASAPEMNPTLSADYLQRMEIEDPEGYRSEVLGEFKAGVSTFLDPAVIAACVDEGIKERLPQVGITYSGFVDAASGSGKDAFTVSIAHAEGEQVVLDVVRAWRSPFNPSGVIAEASDVFKKFGVHEVAGDRWAPGLVAESFRTHGITYQYAEHDRSGLYLELLPLLNAERVRLLDHPELLKELRGLERRRGNSGRDKVDHMRNAHDDIANSCAGSLVLAHKPAYAPMIEVCNC